MRRVLLALMCVSCLDKAKPDWDRCVERDKAYDVPGAYSACAAATAADSKSVSGQSAAKKLLDLQLMLDKMKAERDDKVARDEAIKAQLPPVVTNPVPIATATPTATAVDPAGISRAAKDLATKGDQAGARALLEPLLLSGKGSKDDARMLLGICKAQHDAACVAAFKKIPH